MMTFAPKALLIAAVLAIGTTGLAAARDRLPEFQGIMVEEGQPITKKRGDKPRKGEKLKREDRQRQTEDEPRPRRRGSSTYIPPPNPSPNTPTATVAQPTPGVYQPPRINSYSDRVTNCIHSAPLNAGVGNNPADRSAYIRQCSN